MKAKVPRTVTRDHMEERIQYLDMLALMALHEEFGFGADRLRRYYRAILKMDDIYSRYRAGEPDWGKKDRNGYGRMDIYKLKRDLADIGFDYDEMVDEGIFGDETGGLK